MRSRPAPTLAFSASARSGRWTVRWRSATPRAATSPSRSSIRASRPITRPSAGGSSAAFASSRTAVAIASWTTPNRAISSGMARPAPGSSMPSLRPPRWSRSACSVRTTAARARPSPPPSSGPSSERFGVVESQPVVTQRGDGRRFHELADEAYFANTLLVAAANNVLGPSYPSLFAAVVSVAAHDIPDPDVWLYNPTPPVEFGAHGLDVDVAWRGGGRIRANGQLVRRATSCRPGGTHPRRATPTPVRSRSRRSSRRPPTTPGHDDTARRRPDGAVCDARRLGRALVLGGLVGRDRLPTGRRGALREVGRRRGIGEPMPLDIRVGVGTEAFESSDCDDPLLRKPDPLVRHVLVPFPPRLRGPDVPTVPRRPVFPDARRDDRAVG